MTGVLVYTTEDVSFERELVMGLTWLLDSGRSHQMYLQFLA